MSSPDLTRPELAALIDHTLLTPEADPRDVERLCDEAQHLGVYAVCVSASRVADAARRLTGTTINVVSVIGFPSGAHQPEIKRAEAERAVADGADELDMVIDLGHAKSGEWGAVEDEITAVRAGIGGTRLLKVIIEAAALDASGIVAACRAAERAGADFVKSSTGFHPAGGADIQAIQLMAQTVRPRLGVKASGGIRTAETALAMISAGATRLGMSHSAAVLEELSRMTHITRMSA